MIILTWAFLAGLLATGGVLTWHAWRAVPWDAPRVFGVAVIAVISAIAVVLRFRMPWHHVMYVDEPWYEEAARNVLRRGAPLLCEQTFGAEVCGIYPKAAGWPAVLATAFALGGVHERTAFAASAVIGGLSAPAAALAARVAGGRWPHAALAAVLFAFHPLDLVFSGTVETNAASTTFLLLGLAGLLVARRSGRFLSAVAGIGGLGIAASMRPELWVGFIPFLIAIPFSRGRRLFTLVLGGAALAALPGVISSDVYALHANGPIFQLSYVLPNVRTFAADVGGGRVLSLVIAGAAFLGMIVVVARQGVWEGLTLGGVALFVTTFVTGYYPPAGFASRVMLGALAPLVVLAAQILPRSDAAAWLLAGVLGAGAGVLTWEDRARIAAVPQTQRAETALASAAEQVRLPAASLVLAEWPTVITATSDLAVMKTQKAISAGAAALADRARERPLFLSCDMFCERLFAGAKGSACRTLLQTMALEPVTIVGEPERKYGFFRITGIAKPGQAQTCPGD